MPNHVHLVLVPRDADGLRAALGETHRRYTRQVNEREGWRGYLWQGRFASCRWTRHLLAAVRYVELNPVRAGLTERAIDWPWSSVRAHVEGRADPLLTPEPLRFRLGAGLEHFFDVDVQEEGQRTLRSASSARAAFGRGSVDQGIGGGHRTQARAAVHRTPANIAVQNSGVGNVGVNRLTSE